MSYLVHFVLVFFSPFGIAITSLGDEKANLNAFRMFDRFVLVWICRFPLPPDVLEGLWFVFVALLRLFSYLFCYHLSYFSHVLNTEKKVEYITIQHNMEHSYIFSV